MERNANKLIKISEKTQTFENDLTESPNFPWSSAQINFNPAKSRIQNVGFEEIRNPKQYNWEGTKEPVGVLAP